MSSSAKRTIKLAFRTVGAALGWFIFFYWWSIVLRPPMASKMYIIESVAAVATTTLVVLGAAIGWIRHNLIIARKSRRGDSSRFIAPRFEQDYFGRVLRLPPLAVLRNSSVIQVRIEANRKNYTEDILRLEPGQDKMAEGVGEVA